MRGATVPHSLVWIEIEGTVDRIPSDNQRMRIVHNRGEATPLTLGSAQQAVHRLTDKFRGYDWRPVSISRSEKFVVQGIAKKRRT